MRKRSAAAVSAFTLVAIGAAGSSASRAQGRPFELPLLQALDTDHDGELSSKEIENAAVNLKTLDKNKDGKVTRERRSV